MHTVQKRTWEENDKFKFHIFDQINGNLFLSDVFYLGTVNLGNKQK